MVHTCPPFLKLFLGEFSAKVLCVQFKLEIHPNFLIQIMIFFSILFLSPANIYYMYIPTYILIHFFIYASIPCEEN